MKRFLSFGMAALALAPPLVSQNQLWIVDPAGGGTHTTITAAAAVADDGDDILIKPFIGSNPALLTGYTESSGEVFPITIQPGVHVKKWGNGGETLAVWSSTASPPSALFKLVGSPTARATRIEDIFFFGGTRAIQVDTNSDFNGVIARCQFGWNTMAIDVENASSSEIDLAIRDCKIRSPLPIPPGDNDPPVFQDPAVGIRLHAVRASASGEPPVVNVEIRNLETIGSFDSMATTGPSIPGTYYLGASAQQYFTRLIEIYIHGDGDKEHSGAGGFAPIPEVNVNLLGGDLAGKATSNDPSAGWDVGVFATTRAIGDQLRDFGGGYRIDANGGIIDGFKLAGVHAVVARWHRGEVSLGGGVTVRDTGRHLNQAPDNDHSGVQLYCDEAYLGLKADQATSSSNLGHGVFARTKSTILDNQHKAPSGLYFEVADMEIHENGKHGIAMQVESDGIVGGAWHFVDIGGGSFVRSLVRMPGYDYSVDYGQGVIDSCSISNNGEAGVHFLTSYPSTFFNVRLVNSIIWNNFDGGYLADFDEDSDSTPTFLVPLAHCTVAGNEATGSNEAFSINIREHNRAGGFTPTYAWSGPGGSLRTKFYNSILQRKDPSEDDFPEQMIVGANKFVLDDAFPVGLREIGAAGLRYQDSEPASPLFAWSIHDTSPFEASSILWTSLDATQFYLGNLGANEVFGETPFTLPIEGMETDLDHENDPRPAVSTGERDKGADEIE